MEFGVVLPTFGPPARDPALAAGLREIAEAADDLGYDLVFTAEHLIFPNEIHTPYPYGGRFPYPVDDPVLDPPATLAWVAALTRHVRLGASVMVLPYREPIALAKALATIDVLSGGRLMVGVASGWLREEFELLGVPFRERGARTDEYLAAMRAPRSWKGTPRSSNSSRSHPLATPTIRRPPDSTSMVASALASAIGSRYGSTITEAPSRTCRVSAATQASVAGGSRTGSSTG